MTDRRTMSGTFKLTVRGDAIGTHRIESVIREAVLNELQPRGVSEVFIEAEGFETWNRDGRSQGGLQPGPAVGGVGVEADSVPGSTDEPSATKDRPPFTRCGGDECPHGVKWTNVLHLPCDECAEDGGAEQAAGRLGAAVSPLLREGQPGRQSTGSEGRPRPSSSDDAPADACLLCGEREPHGHQWDGEKDTRYSNHNYGGPTDCACDGGMTKPPSSFPNESDAGRGDG